MISSPDTPASSPVAPDSFSGEPIPGLPGHLVVAHVLGEEKMPDPTHLARISAVSRGMRDAVAATKRKVQEPYEEEAVAKGFLSTVKHMYARGRLSREELLCAAAASSARNAIVGGCLRLWWCCRRAAPGVISVAPGFVRSFLCPGPVPQRERAARELLALGPLRKKLVRHEL